MKWNCCANFLHSSHFLHQPKCYYFTLPKARFVTFRLSGHRMKLRLTLANELAPPGTALAFFSAGAPGAGPKLKLMN